MEINTISGKGTYKEGQNEYFNLLAWDGSGPVHKATGTVSCNKALRVLILSV